jgi:hypothetical protein
MIGAHNIQYGLMGEFLSEKDIFAISIGECTNLLICAIVLIHLILMIGSSSWYVCK